MANWIYNSQIKDMVGIEAGYTAQDTLISQINATTTATLESLLGRTLTKATYVEYHNSKYNSTQFADVYGNGPNAYGYTYKEIKYNLKQYPVITDPEEFKIEYRPGFLIDGAEDILEANEYQLDEENGTFIVTRPVTNFTKGFKVTYTAGYEAEQVSGEFALSPNLPADLVQAALWQSAHTYEKMNLSNINVRESRGQGSSNSSRYVNINAIAPEAMAIIVQHKRRFFTIV